jgi:UDP-N-acetylglucosamine--N-acetylmuramyl-(pentapeptide) pyrophosphoryl-undecaprenol N-acetylglucosamine transferase
MWKIIPVEGESMTDKRPPTVLIMAGGTGGHVFPALATADYLRDSGAEVHWLGTQKGIESQIVPGANIPIHYIDVSGVRGKGLISVLKAPLQLLRALSQALKIMRELQPACVLGMGGFASGPGGLAAWLTGRPLVIHEQNAVAGTTNRLLSCIAKKILQAYPAAFTTKKAEQVGNPVRKNITQLPVPEQRWKNRSGNLNLLVLGGSLGAKAINDVMPTVLATMPEAERPNVWHQSGKLHIDSLKAAYLNAGVEVKAQAFIDDMAEAYAWADLVVCRAGALTITELTAVGVGSILVPYPHAIDDHQTKNALWLADNKAAILLPQNTLDEQSLKTLLAKFFNNRERLLTMANAARKLAKPDAAKNVARHCLELAGKYYSGGEHV